MRLCVILYLFDRTAAEAADKLLELCRAHRGRQGKHLYEDLTKKKYLFKKAMIRI